MQENSAIPLTMPRTVHDTAARYVLVSPDFMFGTTSKQSRSALERVLTIISQSPHLEFVLFTARLQTLIEQSKDFPANLWIGYIAENEEDFQCAESIMPQIMGVRRLLVLRPADNIDWEFHPDFYKPRARVNDPDCPGRLCDWMVIENAYTGKARRARMNGVNVLRAEAYAREAGVPCYVDPELLVSLPWRQDYPAPSGLPTTPDTSTPKLQPVVVQPLQRLPCRPGPEHDEIIVDVDHMLLDDGAG